jgi:hypothetical protein
MVQFLSIDQSTFLFLSGRLCKVVAKLHFKRLAHASVCGIPRIHTFYLITHCSSNLACKFANDFNS